MLPIEPTCSRTGFGASRMNHGRIGCCALQTSALNKPTSVYIYIHLPVSPFGGFLCTTRLVVLGERTSCFAGLFSLTKKTIKNCPDIGTAEPRHSVPVWPIPCLPLVRNTGDLLLEHHPPVDQAMSAQYIKHICYIYIYIYL